MLSTLRSLKFIAATYVGHLIPQTAGDDWVCRVERVSSGWRLLRCDPIMIITELNLTNRWRLLIKEKM